MNGVPAWEKKLLCRVNIATVVVVDITLHTISNCLSPDSAFCFISGMNVLHSKQRVSNSV